MSAAPQEEYIRVIVPLKLDWCPTYRVPPQLRGQLAVGDRVKVRIGPRLTDAVVSETAVVPDIDPKRIHALEAKEDGLERITPEEIRLWKFIADYYLCTQGEVFKCAYPSGKIRSEETAARVKERAEASQRKLQEAARLRVAKLEAEIQSLQTRTAEALSRLSEKAVKTRQKLEANRDTRLQKLQEALSSARALADELGKRSHSIMLPLEKKQEPLSILQDEALSQAMKAGKPILLQGSATARFDSYHGLIRDVLSQGHTALLFVPEIALTEAFEADMKDLFGDCTLVFHSRETTAQRRKIADALRSPGAHLLIGTRSALFLPYRELQLVIIDEEQDRSYKQDSPAPRYNARDCAVILGTIHHAQVVLGSGSPSLESLYNCTTQRYTGLQLETPANPGKRLRVIDISAERRKRGMRGQFSLKLIDEIHYTLSQGGCIYLIRLWGDTVPTQEEARQLFPDAGDRIQVGTLSQTKQISFAEGSLVAILQADAILSAQNFRADERAFQLFSRYREHCAAGTFVIQTGRSEHPVFQALLAGREPWPELMEERKAFSYPPYSRIIDLLIADANPKRLTLMTKSLCDRLIRCFRPSPEVRIEGPYETSEEARTLRAILPKGRLFATWKEQLKQTVDTFASERKYVGFIHINVDPE